MILYTPLSYIFPYTTLFRSKPQPSYGNILKEIEPILLLKSTRKERIFSKKFGKNCLISRLEKQCPILICPKKLGIDRKSTRLNSSHVKISYAVFCLKKKIII